MASSPPRGAAAAKAKVKKSGAKKDADGKSTGEEYYLNSKILFKLRLHYPVSS
jgi:hypothetical protein